MRERSERRTLLAYRALGLGDLLTAVPALRALAIAYPWHRRLLAAPAALRPLVLLAGVADDVVDTRPFEPLGEALAARGVDHVDVAVNLHGRGPQSHGLLRSLEPGRLLGFADPDDPSSAGPSWRADEHEVHRWCRMLEAHGVGTDRENFDIASPPATVAAALGPRVVGSIVIHVGAASESRRWPVDRFAAVARVQLERGHHVAFTGSAGERSLAERAAALAGASRSSVLAGRTDLVELAAVVGSAHAVVCGDTGVAHLATATGTPSVVLFGPTPPDHWGPPPGRRRHVPLWSGTTGDPHAHEPDHGLLQVDVDSVLAALDRSTSFHGPVTDDHVVSISGGHR